MLVIEVSKVSHIGIRVTNLERSLAFYRRLGFELVAQGEDHYVAILKNKHRIEINLIVNASDNNSGENILMDVSPKYPGYTHVALAVSSIDETIRLLGENDIDITGGPAKLGNGVSLFIRDPDCNVIELRESHSP
ncbi:MAG: VOC family protein [Acidiferrobacterales bacterium]